MADSTGASCLYPAEGTGSEIHAYGSRGASAFSFLISLLSNSPLTSVFDFIDV